MRCQGLLAPIPQVADPLVDEPEEGRACLALGFGAIWTRGRLAWPALRAMPMTAAYADVVTCLPVPGLAFWSLTSDLWIKSERLRWGRWRRDRFSKFAAEFARDRGSLCVWIQWRLARAAGGTQRGDLCRAVALNVRRRRAR